MKNNLKIGLFGVGLEAYWSQFPTLKNNLENNLATIHKHIQAINSNVFNAGLVDNIDRAFEAGDFFREKSVDIIFLYITTYALSATILPVVQKAKVPVIILNLAPNEAIDYKYFANLPNRQAMTEHWLSYCSACTAPEIANVFKRVGINFFQIVGHLNDKESLAEIKDWIEATQVANILFYNRLGVMGHYYSGMLDIYTDITLQHKYFGGYTEIIEVDELADISQNVLENEIQEKLAIFQQEFDIQEDCSKEELHRAARTSCALDKLTKKYKLGSLAYFYRGLHKNEDVISSVILGNSLLTANNIPVAGELEIKNIMAMKIMDSFKAGGSFSEYYAIDFNDDVILFGHDGPGHLGIAEGKVKVRPLNVYHGKVGSGLSVEMAVKKGKITLLSVVEQTGDKLMLLVAEGESVSGETLAIGNTNSRYKFSIGAKQFINDWNSHAPAHHCAIGVGHIANKIKKLANILNMDVVQVC
ncbi:MAG: arabinose isomerase [Alphaproteobacteria bacterium]|jgi:L-arabinose isomerase|nr:arabinose isomerase [Alphaproteobacteria bacterium]